MSNDTEIRVRILQLGQRVIEQRGRAGSTLAAALDAAGILPNTGMDMRLNGQVADATTVLHDGDVITLIPRIKGG